MPRAVWMLVVALAASTARAGALAPRIVNGVETTDHPAVGALLSPAGPDFASLVCTGTLIGCQTFLTAAHCVEDNLDPADYGVFFQHAGFVDVSAIAIHPSYEFPVADVAVLTLAAPVTGIRPMPIDTVGGQPAGTAGTIAGFGRSGGSADDYGLKRAGLVETAPCASGISNTTSICWDFTAPLGPPGEDSNTCNGDSGGPLFIDGGSGDVVAGITSGGTSASCLPSDHSYDTRMATYAGYVQTTGGPDVGATSCSNLPQIGTSNTTVFPFSGTLDVSVTQLTHAFTVPAGTERLRVTMNGVDDGSDFDLYVRAGTPPTTAAFDCAVATTGQFGACEFTDPAPGTWHVLIDRFSGDGRYQATASVFVPICADPGNEGLPCDDGNACTAGETCSAGSCAGGGAVTCDDGVACTADSCAPATGCVFAPQHEVCGACAACDASAGCVEGPRPDCRDTALPGTSILKLRDAGFDTGDLLIWKWTKGDATGLADFGAPTASTDYRLCLYDESGPSPTLRLTTEVPAGGLCGAGACWQATQTGYKYRDAEGTPDGMLKVLLKAGATGRAKVTTKAKGDELPPLPPLPLALPLRVQLHGDGAACFEARFDTAGTVRNDGEFFVGRGD
jgi:hypothetical protein